MAPVRRTKANRVFVDSSVLIAAAISERGSARDLLRKGFRDELDLYISPAVLEESERNLYLKAHEALPDFYLFRDLLVARLVDPPESLILAVAKIVEPKDAPIVAAAAHGRVKYLATYDRKHLLPQKDKIRTHFGLIVATPNEVLSFEKKLLG